MAPMIVVVILATNRTLRVVATVASAGDEPSVLVVEDMAERERLAMRPDVS